MMAGTEYWTSSRVMDWVPSVIGDDPDAWEEFVLVINVIECKDTLSRRIKGYNSTTK